jgi:hypothetical protein
MATQLRKMLYTVSQDMLVLSSTDASSYYNCCTDGSVQMAAPVPVITVNQFNFRMLQASKSW